MYLVHCTTYFSPPTMYVVQCTAYFSPSKTYAVHCTVYFSPFTMYVVHRTTYFSPYGEQCTRIRSHMILCTLIYEIFKPYGVRTAYALHSTTYILRHIEYNINCTAYFLPTTMYPGIYILRRITQRVQFSPYIVLRTIFAVHCPTYNLRRT